MPAVMFPDKLIQSQLMVRYVPPLVSVIFTPMSKYAIDNLILSLWVLAKLLPP